MANRPNVCACGNEQGKPRVSPFPVSFIDVVTKHERALLYNGGKTFVDGQMLCWFCILPRKKVKHG